MRYILALLILTISLTAYCQGSKDLQNQARTYREEGYKLQSVGNYEGALSYYSKAVELDARYYEVYNDLGVLYESMGNEDMAVQMYNKTLDINKDYLPVYTNLAFYYERKGDIQQASKWWTKRFEAGRPGDYWQEVAKQHLLALGTYPELKREALEKKALELSKEVVYKREQARLKVLEEARLHFDMAAGLFNKSDFPAAIRELEFADSLDYNDNQLRKNIREMEAKAKKSHAKTQALAAAQSAVAYINAEDYLSAGEKLKAALAAVLQMSADKN